MVKTNRTAFLSQFPRHMLKELFIKCNTYYCTLVMTSLLLIHSHSIKRAYMSHISKTLYTMLITILNSGAVLNTVLQS